MRRPRNSRIRAGAIGTIACALGLLACNAILDFGQFEVGALDASADVTPVLDASDAGSDASNPNPLEDAGNDGAVDCTKVDLTKACYPCAPTTTEQFLNECVEGTCVQFDQARVTPQLVDGKLPAVPDGGIN